ncbi:MAG TPA: DUF6282 family protein [Ktedonobacteraceae bacterium]|nr:DUF6282 family protein [Ktedonobacteraceae bacterium]
MDLENKAGYAGPSARARKLVRGAYDLHVHTGPDLLPRRASDLELAYRCRELGLAGFAIKSHYIPSAPRAAYVNALVPEIIALGSVTLNAAIGGINPVAVEIAARAGARIVWMPTFDGVNEMSRHTSFPPGVKPPQWARLQQEMREQGVRNEPVRVVDENGAILPEVRTVLSLIARHSLVLATGHLSRDEIFAVVTAARTEGVQNIIITHPEYPTQNLSVEDQNALVQQGALLEHCFVTAYTGKISWERMFANIRATGGPGHSFLSTDLGQPDNPPIEDGLALMADQFLAGGFTEDEVYQMAVVNTRRLATGEA